MRLSREQILQALYGDPGADQIVPRGGFGTWLVLLSTATMAFLAVFALALSATTLRTAQSWQTDLARTATLQITSTGEDRTRDTELALHVLSTVPGIAEARVVSDLEQRALLAPWFGHDLPLDTLPLPRLIAITTAPSGYDQQDLRLRLAGELPTARLDDHDRWRAPLATAHVRMTWVVALALGLITATSGAITALSARAALAANTQVIDVLRLVGARDSWIAKAFVRRITRRAFLGALIGTVFAVGILAAFPSGTASGAASGTGTSVPSLRPHGVTWLSFAALPLFAAAVAFVTTRANALGILKGRL